MSVTQSMRVSPEEGLLAVGSRRCVPSMSRGRLSVGDIRGQSRNGPCRHCEKLWVALDANALVSDCRCRGDRRTATHERIKDDAFAERKRSAHDLAREGLWLKRRVSSNVSFPRTGRRTANHIAERLIVCNSPETSRLPLPEIVLHAALAGPPEEAPRFPARARHHRHLVKLLMRVLGPITATEGLNQANDLSSLLEAGFDHGNVDEVRKKRVGGDEDVPTRHEDSQGPLCPSRKEVLQVALFFFSKDCEAWKRPACTAVESRWNPPDATFPATKLCLFFRRVLLQTIGGVRDNRLYRMWFPLSHPSEAVPLEQLVLRRARSVRGFVLANSQRFGILKRTVVGLGPEGLAQHSWCLHRVASQNLTEFGRDVAGEDEERVHVGLPSPCQPLNQPNCRFRLSSFESRDVPFGHMEALRELFQGPPPGLTLRSEGGAKIRCRRLRSEVLGDRSACLHGTQDSVVYRSSQPLSMRGGRVGFSRGRLRAGRLNRLQRTVRCAARRG